MKTIPWVFQWKMLLIWKDDNEEIQIKKIQHLNTDQIMKKNIPLNFFQTKMNAQIEEIL